MRSKLGNLHAHGSYSFYFRMSAKCACDGPVNPILEIFTQLNFTSQSKQLDF